MEANPHSAFSLRPQTQPPRRRLLCFSLTLAVGLSLWFSLPAGWAAPFARFFKFTQPDGTELTLWGEGDEFHAVFETTTGYTVFFDPEQKVYFYAVRAPNGENLASSGVLAHQPVPPGLEPHVRMDPQAAAAAARAPAEMGRRDGPVPALGPAQGSDPGHASGGREGPAPACAAG